MKSKISKVDPTPGPETETIAPGPPATKLCIPFSMIREYKRINTIALGKFEGQGERSHAHGIVLGRIQALEWLEDEIEKGRKRL